MATSETYIASQVKLARSKMTAYEGIMALVTIIFVVANVLLYFLVGIPMFSIIFGALSGVFLFIILAVLVNLDSKNKISLIEYEKSLKLYYEQYDQITIPEKHYDIGLNSSFEQPQFAWFKKSALAFFPKPPLYENYKSYSQFGFFEIEFNSIKYFYTSGDKYYENKIFGGGSTGPNLTGAVIGQQVAGVGGAIVMGQSQNLPIESRLIIHDERRTVVLHHLSDGTLSKCLLPFDFYDIMNEHLPELSRDVVENQIKIKMAKKTSEDDSIEVKLKKLMDLKTSGLIDENDYQQQKKKILDNIS